MEFLSQHIKETIDRVDGYSTGTLVVDEGKVSLLQSDNTEILLDDTYSIEVRGDDKYFPLDVETVKTRLSTDGWHLYAGLYARVKSS